MVSKNSIDEEFQLLDKINKKSKKTLYQLIEYNIISSYKLVTDKNNNYKLELIINEVELNKKWKMEYKNIVKKLLLLTGIMLIFASVSVNASTFNIISYDPTDIKDTSATIKAKLYNPSNHLLNISIYYKKLNNTNYNKINFVENITQDEYDINYYVTNLTPTAQYEYYIIGERQEKNRNEIVKSNTIQFMTNKSSGIFSVNTDKDLTVLILLLMLVAGLFLILFTSIKFVGSLLILITGIILLFSSVNIVISLVIILGGFTALFIS